MTHVATALLKPCTSLHINASEQMIISELLASDFSLQKQEHCYSHTVIYILFEAAVTTQIPHGGH